MRSIIPSDDFGEAGPLLHFAHANAYPPACYRQLLETLSDGYRVRAIRQRPLWPGSRPGEISEWKDIGDDLISFFEQQKFQSVIGVGHSLGAVATVMAALSRPELFRALVLIEPVFLSPDILEAVDKLVKSGKGDDLPLVKVARMRKREWSSRREAFSHFRPKRVFSGWSDKSLHDYVTYGLRENEAGDLTLTYPPEWEARIYATVPTDVWELIPQITQPTLAIRGGKSDTMSDTAWELWQRRQPGATFVEMANSGHLLPMEEPQAVADKIKDFLDSQLID